ncbi:MAG TPA: carboxylesterase family protein [Steroidobacteraceae bacterium]|nr:carboxylesterase family protein [Steroidobacteraceae bacterium]
MRGSWLASLTAIALAQSAAAALAQIPRAHVTGGWIAGTVVDGVSEFKGIPFAAPPVGSLRWKAPQPVRPWHGVRQTVAFGPACMQDPRSASRQAPGVSLSEDCLYLDVWTAAKTPGERRPVIAWIYGGGFTGGMTSAPLYDGTHFAQKGVVFVSIAYRVGALGFLATRELARESGHGSGNYGLLDQIAGLKWIRRNVAQFGGDPAKVTLLGHSAGGFSVSMLAGSPRTRGLFRGVISESGANFMPPEDSPWGGGSIETLRMAEAGGEQWLEGLGAKTLAQARALPADQIVAAQRGRGGARFWPPLDGYVIVGDQYQLWRHHRFNDTPILVGDVSDEAAGFGVRKMEPAAFEAEVRSGYGKEADAILAAYPHATVQEATRAATELRSDTTFDWGQYTWARLQAAHGEHPAYVYYFDRPTARDPNGSGHGQEVGYVFGNLGVGGRPAPTAEDRAISEEMQSYWVNFARQGNPNGPGVPQWPAFTAAAPLVMRIGVDPGPAPLPHQDRLKVLTAYYAWRRAGSN